MSTKPIIFSGPMVRALLDGRKTQTRRVCKFPRNYARIDFMGGRGDFNDPSAWGFEHPDTGHWALKSDGKDVKEIRCPYGQPSDLLYVREAHSLHSAHGQHRSDGNRWGPWGDLPTQVSDDGTQIAYFREGFDRSGSQRWRPSIHMPRWASRLTLRITDVRVERVQDISERDARLEGVSFPAEPNLSGFTQIGRCTAEFAGLWDAINAKRGYGWDANPWVWAISFEVIHANVDAVREG